jgi:predicted anti-sigma-YlaC factor YlaD
MSDMTNGCRKIRPLLEGYFEGVLPPPEERMVTAHLWQCPRCTAEVEQIRRLAMALEALPRMEPAEELVGAIVDRIASLPAAAQRRNVWAGWRHIGVVGAAVIAVMALSRYAGTPLLPLLYGALGKLWGYLGGVTGTLQAAWQALLPLAPVLKSLGVALLEAMQAVAPTVGRYAAMEAVVLIALSLLIRRGHVRALASSYQQQ